MWTMYHNIGLKKLAVMAFFSLVQFVVIYFFPSVAPIEIIVFLICIWAFLFISAAQTGVCKRVYSVVAAGDTYSVIDQYFPLNKVKNKRVLTQESVHVEGVLSAQYHTPQMRWAYLDIMRIVLCRWRFPANRSALILGGGGGCMGYSLKSRLGFNRVDMVEIYAQIIEIAQRYFAPKDVKGVSYIHADATDFIHQTKKTYDCIIVDIFKGTTPEPSLFHSSFLKSVKSHVRTKGVIIFNLGFHSLNVSDKIGQLFPELRLCIWAHSLVGFWSPSGTLKDDFFEESGAMVLPIPNTKRPNIKPKM